jgi:hypothetical protein
MRIVACGFVSEDRRESAHSHRALRGAEFAEVAAAVLPFARSTPTEPRFEKQCVPRCVSNSDQGLGSSGEN